MEDFHEALVWLVSLVFSLSRECSLPLTKRRRRKRNRSKGPPDPGTAHQGGEAQEAAGDVDAAVSALKKAGSAGQR